MKRVIEHICIIMLVLSLSTCASTPEKRWERLTSRYAVVSEQGEKDSRKPLRAVEIAKKALQVAEQDFKPDDPRVAQSLFNLAEAYVYAWDFTQSEPLYKRALAIYERIGQKETLAYAKTLIGLGIFYSLQQQYDQGLIQYQQAVGILEKLPQPNTIELANVLD